MRLNLFLVDSMPTWQLFLVLVFSMLTGLRLIYVSYIIYKSSPRASGVRLSRDKARRILLPTSKINLGNSALMPIFLICFLGKEALCVSAA